MHKYVVFLQERIPFISYATLTTGLTLSGAALTGEPFALDYPRRMVFIALMLLFIDLRFMDEVKDVAKDLVAHPLRPVPRGLISEVNLKVLIWITVLIMLLTASWHLINRYAQAGISLFLLTGYSVLMYKEFFIPKWLGARPWIYALAHQFILYFVCWHSISFHSFSRPLWLSFGTMVTAVFFTYEIGRKLDPQSHPILRTYRQVYGVRYIQYVILFLSALTAVAASQLGLLLWSLPMLLLVNWAMIFMMKTKFKVGEALSSMSLLYHLWLPFLKESISQ